MLLSKRLGGGMTKLAIIFVAGLLSFYYVRKKSRTGEDFATREDYLEEISVIHYQDYMVHHDTPLPVAAKTTDVTHKKESLWETAEIQTTEPAKDHTDPRKTKNVLFIVSDDLRPQIGAYEGDYYPEENSKVKMHTPNLDRLSEKSLLLTRAYAQYSLCAPSRTSFLTGRRPDTTKVWDLVTYWRVTAGDFTTIPQHFKNHGYTTAGAGKIFHGGKSARHFDTPSWSKMYKRPKHGSYWNSATVKDTWRAVSKGLRVNKPLPDEEITTQAKNYLTQFAPDALSGKAPFFLGVGFHKPHLPLVFPKEYLDLYPLEKMDMPENCHCPSNFPRKAYISAREIMGYNDIKSLDFGGAPNETLPEQTAKELRRAYFACVSYIDSMVGEVLKTLDDLKLTNSTIVSFIGDHGWHLGENGHWGKHTNFEQGTHAPMMIHIPEVTDHGVRSDSLVEFVDLFPTIVEAAGLGKIPRCPKDSADVKVCTEGESILRLIEHPTETLKSAAFSQMTRNGSMGYSMRNNRYRYTEWAPLRRSEEDNGLYHYDIMWNSLLGAELYDHDMDPMENINIAFAQEMTSVRETLSKELHEQFSWSIDNAHTII